MNKSGAIRLISFSFQNLAKFSFHLIACVSLFWILPFFHFFSFLSPPSEVINKLFSFLRLNFTFYYWQTNSAPDCSIHCCCSCKMVSLCKQVFLFVQSLLTIFYLIFNVLRSYFFVSFFVAKFEICLQRYNCNEFFHLQMWVEVGKWWTNLLEEMSTAVCV